jgi:ribosomal protein S8E
VGRSSAQGEADQRVRDVWSGGVGQARKYVGPLDQFINHHHLCADRCLLLNAGKSWKRMVRKVTFVGDNFTRKPPKYERFIRPAALRFKVGRTHFTYVLMRLKTTHSLTHSLFLFSLLLLLGSIRKRT